MTALAIKAIMFRNQASNFLQRQLTQIKSNDSGVTAVEYALIIGLIAIVIIGAVTLLGTSISNIFSKARCSVVGGVWTEATSTCSK